MRKEMKPPPKQQQSAKMSKYQWTDKAVQDSEELPYKSIAL